MGGEVILGMTTMTGRGGGHMGGMDETIWLRGGRGRQGCVDMAERRET